jgi:hypothetical protein
MKDICRSEAQRSTACSKARTRKEQSVPCCLASSLSPADLASPGANLVESLSHRGVSPLSGLRLGASQHVFSLGRSSMLYEIDESCRPKSMPVGAGT